MLATVALLLTLPAASAHAVTAQRAIDLLNAQRAANGIPAGIVENPDWSNGCALHNEYLRLNPDEWSSNPHDERPGRPGYTQAGRQAAQSSVLSSADGYADTGATNPWEYAPIHLMQLLAPQLSVTGYADTPGACMWTWPGYQRPGPAQPALYSYPGDGATIYSSMTANESPFVPGDFVQLPKGTKTGPHLYVFADGADDSSVRGTITSASLTGPSGPVEVRTVDNGTEGPLGRLGTYLPPGGIVIPVRPLQANASYTAAVTFATEGGATLSRTWTFRTRAPQQSITLPVRRVRSGRSFVLRYVAADDGRITISLSRGRKTYVRGTLRVKAGTGFVTMRTGKPGAYTLRALLETSVSTTFSAQVRVLAR
jgi:hypothetical protein